MTKKNLLVLFGGQSSEHEVSCESAITIISSINIDKYNVFIIGITKEGNWLRVENVDDIISKDWYKSSVKAIVSPDSTEKSVVYFKEDRIYTENIDVIFPILHGKFGEDGTIQGLLEMSHIPYVGCGVLSSSASIDKLYTKILVEQLNIRQAKYVSVLSRDLNKIDTLLLDLETSLSYPMFVKPSKAGSSQGISKCFNQTELIKGLYLASEHDTKILVEDCIIGREIECGILGGSQIEASGIGEVITKGKFYSYDAKYNGNSAIDTAPNIPKVLVEKIRNYALKIFNQLDAYGLARVDFFIERDTNEIIFNEINTMPGFTKNSMYPMLWLEKGIDMKELTDILIELSFSR